MDLELLRRIDAYLDAVPRPTSRVETIGPFAVFVQRLAGWPYYARPTPGATSVSATDVAAVRDRQRELGVPEEFEWVHELVPALEAAAREAGLEVVRHPLMLLDRNDVRRVPPPPGAEIRLATPQDDLATLHGVVALAFSVPGTEVGSQDHAEAARIAAEAGPDLLVLVEDRMRRELTVTAVALVEGRPVAAGSHNPIGDATEIVGVGTLPAFRRRGLGAAVTSALVEDALGRGATTILLSAGDEEIARVYERVGFRVVGTAAAAQPPA
jgi:GNAT superfamily N-acetyltransferase